MFSSDEMIDWNKIEKNEKDLKELKSIFLKRYFENDHQNPFLATPKTKKIASRKMHKIAIELDNIEEIYYGWRHHLFHGFPTFTKFFLDDKNPVDFSSRQAYMDCLDQEYNDSLKKSYFHTNFIEEAYNTLVDASSLSKYLRYLKILKILFQHSRKETLQDDLKHWEECRAKCKETSTLLFITRQFYGALIAYQSGVPDLYQLVKIKKSYSHKRLKHYFDNLNLKNDSEVKFYSKVGEYLGNQVIREQYDILINSNRSKDVMVDFEEQRQERSYYWKHWTKLKSLINEMLNIRTEDEYLLAAEFIKENPDFLDWSSNSDNLYTRLNLNREQLYAENTENTFINRIIRKEYISLERTPEVNLAYTILKNPEKREIYNFCMENFRGYKLSIIINQNPSILNKPLHDEILEIISDQLKNSNGGNYESYIHELNKIHNKKLNLEKKLNLSLNMKNYIETDEFEDYVFTHFYRSLYIIISDNQVIDEIDDSELFRSIIEIASKLFGLDFNVDDSQKKLCVFSIITLIFLEKLFETIKRSMTENLIKFQYEQEIDIKSIVENLINIEKDKSFLIKLNLTDFNRVGLILRVVMMQVIEEVSFDDVHELIQKIYEQEEEIRKITRHRKEIKLLNIVKPSEIIDYLIKNNPFLENKIYIQILTEVIQKNGRNKRQLARSLGMKHKNINSRLKKLTSCGLLNRIEIPTEDKHLLVLYKFPAVLKNYYEILRKHY